MRISIFSSFQTLADHGFTFDMAFSSVLLRATKTLDNILDEMDLEKIPVQTNWKLNERMYGTLEGRRLYICRWLYNLALVKQK